MPLRIFKVIVKSAICVKYLFKTIRSTTKKNYVSVHVCVRSRKRQGEGKKGRGRENEYA